MYRQKHLRKTLKPSIWRDLGVPPQSPAQQRISTRPAGFNGRLQHGSSHQAAGQVTVTARCRSPWPLRPTTGTNRAGAHTAAQPGKGQRPKPGRWPRDTRPRVSRPIVRPGERIGKTSRGSNVKSQSVAFGIRQTDSDAHRGITPRWRDCRPRAGLPRAVARDRQPAAGCSK
jgi:hypothetical protein